ncbi:MAG: radical SAM protein [Candidatus Schekmanbacteria bacterium]|nr:radical SAM protein [Candidatus Schekmanbacteria bacterium]
MDVLLSHGYFLDEDAAEQQIMRPFPPLGLLYVAAYLAAKGVSAGIYDSTFGSRTGFLRYLEDARPPVVGLYANMLTRANVLAMARAAKERGAVVVLGGPEPVNYPEEYLARSVDAIVAGEGEETMLELTRHLLGGGGHQREDVAGLLFLDDAGAVHRTPARTLLRELDEIPFPARSKIDIAAYLQAWRARHGFAALSLITARGCPYTCRWCSHAVFGHTHRRRSPANVADELDQLCLAYRPERIWYADDVFTMSHAWLRRYALELDKRRLRVPFETITREDRLDEDIVALLARMGCAKLWIGAESGSQRILDAMDRRTNAARLREMMALLRARGIETGTFIMLGYEGERPEDIAATAEHLRRSAPDSVLVTLAYPIKGTPYYEDVGDRLVRPRGWNWETSSDRGNTVAGRRSRRYYRFAQRWLVSSAMLSGERLRPSGSLWRLVRLALHAAIGRIGMAMTAWRREPDPRPSRRGGGWPSSEIAAGAPFDGAAETYDRDFASHPLGTHLRAIVRRHLAKAFGGGASTTILELGCGTGEDAIWLAGHGHSVVATDASTAMLGIAGAKAAAVPGGGSAGATGKDAGVTFAVLDLSAIAGDSSDGASESGSHRAATPAPPPMPESETMNRLPTLFDGAFSSFGALNCVPDRRAVAAFLARRVRPGGRLVLVLMGPFCPWELLWHLAHGRLADAFRRWRRGAPAQVPGGAQVRVWYPTPYRLARDFSPWFHHCYTASAGSFLPPTYLARVVEGRPRLMRVLAGLERIAGRIFPFTWLNDHYVCVLERRP